MSKNKDLNQALQQATDNTKKLKKQNIILLVLNILLVIVMVTCTIIIAKNWDRLFHKTEEFVPNGVVALEDKTTSKKEQNDIVYLGFTKDTLEFSDNDYLYLPNDKANKNILMLYTLIYDGKEIYTSVPVEAGKQDKVELKKYFNDMGIYHITINIKAVDENNNIYNSMNQNFAFIIK